MQLGFDFTTAPLTGDAAVYIRHRRARRYILRVLDDGTLRVTVPRWGSQREARAFVERSSGWIQQQLHKRQSVPRGPVRDVATLKRRAVAELPGQLLSLAETFSISVTRVSIRNQRTRWGACSSSGAITLNWRLVLTPDFVRDYVMIHELMHRREMNHSARFWKHVAAACPRYAEARAWLRNEGRQLFTGQEIC